MTFRAVFSIDPGITGAIAVFADGELSALQDMPRIEKLVDGRALANFFRLHRTRHPGASFVAVVEHVGGFRGQGGSSSFNFGHNTGTVHGVLQALGIDIELVKPQVWKKHYGLLKSKKTNPDAKKDDARILALEKFPAWREQLWDKKHGGRADAAMIGLWYAESGA